MKHSIATIALLLSAHAAMAQGLVDMSHSKHTRVVNIPVGAVKWTGGFWADRFSTFSNTSIWDMWDTWNTPDLSHGFRNFEIAAGYEQGDHQGPPFHDGDMYKWLEACADVYAVTKDKKLDALMDKFIDAVTRAQRQDGYIHTPVVIDEKNHGRDSHANDNTVIGITVGSKEDKGAFASRLNFETYNLGHLMMAGIVHKRATGKSSLFNCAVKAADFLYNFMANNRDELARNAICPSHYMGVAEMYRATGDTRYLELAQALIDMRDGVKNGEDHNQDRIPLRQQHEAMGHAVRANYLYAGVADLCNETGDPDLMNNLKEIWNDITYHKIYITGGCGALYDGVSPDGTTYDQPYIQQIHQAYGRKYQLPNETAHNETCAQIGNLLFSWRMFEATGEAKYVDMVENELYNGILPGISLSGKDYFYTQSLRRTEGFPYTMRWPKHRQRYISCFCCPPNTLRTLVEAKDYAYAASGDTLWVNLYGACRMDTKDIKISQTTDYPFDGRVTLNIEKASHLKAIRLRVPEWCSKATVEYNGSTKHLDGANNSYYTLTANFRKGDVITFDMDMPVKMMEANPLVEENRNQVAVKRGPLVYCLESPDIKNLEGAEKNAQGNIRPMDIVIPADTKFYTEQRTIEGHTFTALKAEVEANMHEPWKGQLYRPVSTTKHKVNISLIPYYAWDNRGADTDMSVWLDMKR